MPAQSSETFEALKAIMAPYATRLTAARDQPDDFYLNGPQPDRFGKDVFFGAVQSRRSYVSYYLAPVYLNPSLLDGISPELRRRMQGKSCFNFRAVDPDLFRELSELTARSFEWFESHGVASREEYRVSQKGQREPA